MATPTRSIMIDAPVGTVFVFASDIQRSWVAKDVAMTEVDIKPDGVGSSARLYTHLLGFHLEGGLEYTEVIPGERIVAQVHFFAEKPVWRFTFMVKEHEPLLEEMLAHLKTQVEARTAA